MTNSSDRLDRIERILEGASQRIDSNAKAIQAILDAMTEAAEERRELREATLRLEGVAEGIANLLSSLDEDRPTILRKLNTIENKVDRILQRGNGDQPQV